MPQGFKPITFGSIYRTNTSWTWGYSTAGKRKTKTMKSLEKLVEYRLQTIRNHMKDKIVIKVEDSKQTLVKFD